VTRLTDAIEVVDTEFKPTQPGGRHLVENVSIQFNVNTEASESGAHVATVTADLLSAEIRNARIDDVINRWRELAGEIPDVISLKFGESTVGPAGRPIDIRLKGHDLELLKAASLDMQAWLGQFEGVFDLSDDLRPGKPEISIRMREGAKGLGLDAEGVASQLRSAFYGRTASEIQVGRESYEINVRMREEDRNSIADLAYFHVTLPDGKQAPLGSVAVLTESRGYARIAAVDGMRTITVQGDVDSLITNTSQIIKTLNRSFMPEFRQKFPQILTSVEGESKASAETGSSMVRGFVVGLVGIFILLSFQFRSYIEPVVVMVAIPLAFIGVIWGHKFMDMNLSMPGLLGAASLAGIVVNDSILLVEFVKIHVRNGVAVAEAARRASRERFRAVLLTSLTTIAGLLPLLSERSPQAQVLIPLAVSIVFGLMASTVLVLIVVPSLYVILDDLGLTSVKADEKQRSTAHTNIIKQ
jgi:multidrug efflux pump subunit AcrB